MHCTQSCSMYSISRLDKDIIYKQSLCWRENRSSVVLAAPPTLSLSFSLSLPLSVSVTVFVFLYWHVIVFYVGAGCSCSGQKAASQEVWGKKNLFLSETNNRVTERHVTKSRRNAGELTVFLFLERQRNHLTSTRGCLTYVLLLSVAKAHMGPNCACAVGRSEGIRTP